MAYHDSLTGLGNRTMLHRHLSELAIRTASAPDCPLTAGMLLFLDLDDFKSVNDTLGHGIGDRVLQVVAERLRGGVRSQELVVRFGGDEFGLVIGTDDPAVAESLADRLLAALARPMAIGGHDIVLTASVGMAPVLLPDPGAGAAGSTGWIDDLLRRADIALYEAKAQGKGRWERFDPTMEERTRQRVELQHALREAIHAEQFAVYYQPVIDLSTGCVCSLEALVRWHRDAAVIGPDQFIHDAEDSGLIVAIGGWVLQRACHDLGELHRRVPTTAGISVAVNVSGRQLAEPAMAEQVLAALDESGLPPKYLVVEVTETLLTEYPERARRILDRLRDQGISVAVDDFGTGYSSLSRLIDLPVDIVKIDQSFIRPLSGTGQDRNVAIVSAILALAQSLALETVAEGVETSEQLALLRDRSCSRGQGFLFAEPMPFAELCELLASGPCW
jgi:diguanylate cyclase (GGDEF)-like protein